jgi:hypothetical protein
VATAGGECEPGDAALNRSAAVAEKSPVKADCAAGADAAELQRLLDPQVLFVVSST